jgi:hypothetical protein
MRVILNKDQLKAQARKKSMAPHVNDSKPLTPEERRLQQPHIQRQPWLSYNPPTTKYPTGYQLRTQGHKHLMAPHVNDPNTSSAIRDCLKKEAYSEMSVYDKKLFSNKVYVGSC